ncbi:hypothetical protein L6164_006334 [Bauhinia variegata]|uniref:Uncharacterized protein n=1 Tax=Bauhinia variegata TaxID=167791 RepID=A0ACB9PTL3_BAUVA|nr:hypothetical protein L6164_006334 [Bauhinia variegata]
MDGFDKDELLMRSNTHPQLFNEHDDSKLQRPATKTRSTSISIPMKSTEPCEIETIAVESNTEQSPSFCDNGENDLQSNYAGKNEHLLRSGRMGICNDPYCTTCPAYFKITEQSYPNALDISDRKFHHVLYGDAKGCTRRFFSFLSSYVPGVINPHCKFALRWKRFFAISCLVSIFVDPFFFFVLTVLKEEYCVGLNWPVMTTLLILRSMTDVVYFLNTLLQFRLAYVARDWVIGAGELVDHPKKIALHYLKGFFIIDLFAVFPLPQIIVLFVLGNSGVNYTKNLLQTSVLAQYIPRLSRCLPLLIGHSSSGFIFESAWANIIVNLLTIMLSGHVVGSCWYLFGLQRINACLQAACYKAQVPFCAKLIDCDLAGKDLVSKYYWRNNTGASACLTEDGFHYGIYDKAVNLTTEPDLIIRYVFSFFWGFQQISTLAGNLSPSYFIGEVVFTIAIIALGLLIFAILVGNIHNFLQALGPRRLEMLRRRRDVEQWLKRRRLPYDLKRRIRLNEKYHWDMTRGVNEEMFLENLPEDLQRETRRHIFKFIKRVRIFSLMDEPIVDAILERLREKTYIRGSVVLYRGGVIEKMVFIVRGKLESVGEDGTTIPLSEGDVFGEELLTWCLEHSSVNRDCEKVRIPGRRLLSKRTVVCMTNVEAFSLGAADLEEVTSLFSRFLRNPRLQAAIRYESPYWRRLAATRIQVQWRCRKRRLNRV